MRIRLLLLLLTTLFFVQCKSSSTTGPGGDGSGIGTLTATVTDATSHQPISGAIITIGPATVVDSTDATGSFTVKGLASGAHTITIAKAGYQSAIDAFSITSGSTTTDSYTLFLTGGGHTKIVGWQPVTSGTSEDLNAVSFATPTLVYAVGAHGTLLRSVDGGSTWITLQAPTTVNLNAVFFQDTVNGYIVGDSAMLYSTHDALGSWKRIWVPASGTFTSFASPRPLSFYIGGYYPGTNAENILFKTYDDGRNWDEISLRFSDTRKINAVCFYDSTYGIAVGERGLALETSFAGGGWNAASPAASVTYYAVSMMTNQTCIVGGTGGHLYRFDLNGSSLDVGPGTSTTFKGSAAGNSHIDVAVGTGGEITMTTDGGYTWRDQSTGSADYHAVAFQDSVHAVIVGANGVILRSIVQ